MDEKTHVKYLQLSRLTYSFAKRLDPMVKFYKTVKSVLFWQVPEVTIAFGIVLTVIVLFPRISLLIVSLFLIFGRGFIVNMMEGYMVKIDKIDYSKRLLPPE